MKTERAQIYPERGGRAAEAKDLRWLDDPVRMGARAVAPEILRRFAPQDEL